MKTFRKNQKVNIKDFIRLKKGGYTDTVVCAMNSLVSSQILDNNFRVKDNVAFSNLWNKYCK